VNSPGREVNSPGVNNTPTISVASGMRVDFVITELFVGGAERCLTELAIALAQQGDDVRVFSLGPLPEGEQRALVDRLRQARIPIASGQARSNRQIVGVYRRLKNWFAESPPQVCQTFMYHANVLGTFAAQSSAVDIRIGGLRVAERRPLRGAIERAAVRRMQHLVCVSRAVENFATEHLRCDPARVSVIPNGVDVSRFSTAVPIDWQSIGWPADSRVTLFVGRLHPQKGIEQLQQQVDQLAPPNSDHRLLLIGDGPLRADLQRWAATVGTSRVQLLPWQSDIAPWVRGSRLLILPSRYEGMPNVVLEAMAAARPVVCSRVEGVEELLADSTEKQSFPSGDSHAMQELALRFLSDESLSDATGRENQSRVRRDFSIPAMVDAYRTLYRRLRDTRRLDD
jgi:glycosyltransferase involved in cell wall biosynthesis